jgi:hypothetical protein
MGQCSILDPSAYGVAHIQGVDNSKRVKIHSNFFLKKISSPQPAGQIQSNLIHFIVGKSNSSLFK